MATVQTFVDKMRGSLNEASVIFWDDTDKTKGSLLDAFVDGLQWVHAQKKAALGGQLPDVNSPYWQSFIAQDTLSILTGTQEIGLPADFDFIWSLIDTDSELPLSHYDLRLERMHKRGDRFGVLRGHGFYSFVAGAKIRVIVWPGAEGVPQETRTFDLNYYKVMPRHTALADTVIIADEFCTPAVHFGIAQSLLRARESPIEMFQAAKDGVEAIQ